jgi:hypothetical protein
LFIKVRSVQSLAGYGNEQRQLDTYDFIAQKSRHSTRAALNWTQRRQRRVSSVNRGGFKGIQVEEAYDRGLGVWKTPYQLRPNNLCSATMCNLLYVVQPVMLGRPCGAPYHRPVAFWCPNLTTPGGS